MGQDSFPFVKESEEEDASESDDDEDAHLPQTTQQSGMNQRLRLLCIGIYRNNLNLFDI